MRIACLQHPDYVDRPRSIALLDTASVTLETSTAYGHDTAGRLNRVWYHPKLGANGIPQGAPDFMCKAGLSS